jgi:hypothetical protein
MVTPKKVAFGNLFWGSSSKFNDRNFYKAMANLVNWGVFLEQISFGRRDLV